MDRKKEGEAYWNARKLFKPRAKDIRADQQEYESWQCQACGAPIGWLGRLFQKIAGCFLARMITSNRCRR